MTALPGFKASLYATTTPSVAFTNEAMTDGGAHTVYTITNAVKRYWDVSQALTVQTSPDGSTGWTTVTTGFTVNYCGGIITFAVALTGSTPSVRVSGSYLPYSQVASASSVEVQVAVDVIDVSTLGGGGWKQKLAGIADSTYKLSKYWVDNFYVNALTNRTRLVLAIYTGANANQRFEGFGYLKTDSIKFDVKSAIEESIDVEVDGALNSVLS